MTFLKFHDHQTSFHSKFLAGKIGAFSRSWVKVGITNLKRGYCRDSRIFHPTSLQPTIHYFFLLTKLIDKNLARKFYFYENLISFRINFFGIFWLYPWFELFGVFLLQTKVDLVVTVSPFSWHQITRPWTYFKKGGIGRNRLQQHKTWNATKTWPWSTDYIFFPRSKLFNFSLFSSKGVN